MMQKPEAGRHCSVAVEVERIKKDPRGLSLGGDREDRVYKHHSTFVG
jgi:hypothetical protein